MKARQRTSRRGFTLIEVMVAILILSLVMVGLIMVRANAVYSFIQSSDQFSAAWLAELKMQELMSQRLPDPEDEGTWEDEGWGDFAHYDHISNEFNLMYNPDWVDRDHFARFEYRWRKEMVFIGTDFIGSQYDLENWEAPVNEFGEPMEQDDPRQKPAARVVRITLTVYIPFDETEDVFAYSQRNPNTQIIDGRPALRLVTYVDPTVLFDGARDIAEEENAPPG